MNKTGTENNCDAPTNLNVDSAFYDGFDIVMELTKEEKQELLKMWEKFKGQFLQNLQIRLFGFLRPVYQQGGSSN